MNVEHPTSNIQHRMKNKHQLARGKQALVTLAHFNHFSGLSGLGIHGCTLGIKGVAHLGGQNG